MGWKVKVSFKKGDLVKLDYADPPTFGIVVVPSYHKYGSILVRWFAPDGSIYDLPYLGFHLHLVEASK